MRISFTLLLSLTLNFAYAQSSISSSELGTGLGDSIYNIYSEYINPGKAGSNITWDLSAADSIDVQNLTSLKPSATPYASKFPNANVAYYNDGNYSYYLQDDKKRSLLGVYTYSDIELKYTDPDDILRFPIEYQDKYTDTWATSFTSGINFTRTGTTKLEVDGYGTLITPIDTYSNVLRVYMVQEYKDVSQAGTYNYVNKQYFWFKKGIFSALASCTEFESFQGTVENTIYISVKEPVVNSLQRLTKENPISIYPNPASNTLNINFSKLNSASKWSIISIDGRAVLSGDMNASANSLSIDISSLAESIYTFVLSNESGFYSQKVTVTK